MTHKINPAFEIGSAIDPGRKRISGANQDSLIVLKPGKDQELPTVLVVADGMGGYAGGQIASQIVINAFSTNYEKNAKFPPFEQYAASSIDLALAEMQQQAEKDQQYASMGSTVVVFGIEEEKVHVVNVGDSHAYLIHQGQMQQINYDHSFVGEAIRAGLLTQAEAMNHPKKNQLTQSISARRAAIKPYFNTLPLEADDVLLLCSDGLWGVVPEAMIQAVATELSPQQAAEKLVKLANARGGPDNISVIVCKRVGAKPINPFIGGDEIAKKKKRTWSLFNRNRGGK